MTKKHINQAADYFDAVMDEPLTDEQKINLAKLHSLVAELSHQLIDEQEVSKVLKHQVTAITTECETLNSAWVKINNIREIVNVSK